MDLIEKVVKCCKTHRCAKDQDNAFLKSTLDLMQQNTAPTEAPSSNVEAAAANCVAASLFGVADVAHVTSKSRSMASKASPDISTAALATAADSAAALTAFRPHIIKRIN